MTQPALRSAIESITSQRADKIKETRTGFF
jgi:hypothetical protein